MNMEETPLLVGAYGRFMLVVRPDDGGNIDKRDRDKQLQHDIFLTWNLELYT